MTRTTVLVAMLMLVPTIVIAQDVRERGDKACRGDVQRHCKHVVGQGDMAVLSCLQANATRLSGTCTKFLREVGQLN
jgi:cysteine rich repeat protein